MIAKITLLTLVAMSAFAAKEKIKISDLTETTQSFTTIEAVVKGWDLKNLRDGEFENKKCDIVIADKGNKVAVTIRQKAEDREMTIELSKKQLLVQSTNVVPGAGRDDTYSVLKQSSKDYTKLKLAGPFLQIGIAEAIVRVQLMANGYNAIACEFVEAAQQ